jgi:eukaryotic-like serine/threonine-protein kinase
MHTRLIIDVTAGPLKGATYAIAGPGHCVIGRAPNCDIQLARPDDPGFANVSRHHCEVEIEPSEVRIRDLGSRNGTWLNGASICSTAAYLERESDRHPGEFVALKNGDELDIGYSTLRIRVADDADTHSK